MKIPAFIKNTTCFSSVGEKELIEIIKKNFTSKRLNEIYFGEESDEEGNEVLLVGFMPNFTQAPVIQRITDEIKQKSLKEFLASYPNLIIFGMVGTLAEERKEEKKKEQGEEASEQTFIPKPSFGQLRDLLNPQLKLGFVTKCNDLSIIAGISKQVFYGKQDLSEAEKNEFKSTFSTLHKGMAKIEISKFIEKFKEKNVMIRNILIINNENFDAENPTYFPKEFIKQATDVPKALKEIEIFTNNTFIDASLIFKEPAEVSSFAGITLDLNRVEGKGGRWLYLSQSGKGLGASTDKIEPLIKSEEWNNAQGSGLTDSKDLKNSKKDEPPFKKQKIESTANENAIASEELDKEEYPAFQDEQVLGPGS